MCFTLFTVAQTADLDWQILHKRSRALHCLFSHFIFPIVRWFPQTSRGKGTVENASSSLSLSLLCYKYTHDYQIENDSPRTTNIVVGYIYYSIFLTLHYPLLPQLQLQDNEVHMSFC